VTPANVALLAQICPIWRREPKPSRSSKRQPTSLGRSAQRDPILRQTVRRLDPVPGGQGPRKKTPGDRRGEQEPDRRRQADGDDEDAADREDETAGVAGDFCGGEVDLRRGPLRLGRNRNVGRMSIVPDV